ncbi:Aspyridones efflux protein [Sparassis crispa]|uniref:Aspyridones efflux protein n=1 Tax=Sparassis crispa TaxID=139825 RepID=A0A401GTA9_9APHY|nr:Aspyridones efflux protein [Sparassis crispa]GBE85455.1 Aspyridones efflux protein [Sparassis crispa]
MPDLEKSLTVESIEGHYSPTEKSPRSVEDVDRDGYEFAEGGFQGWLTVFGAFLALFCGFGQLSSFGTFQSWYAEHQLRGLPASTISWIGTLQLFLFFLSGGFLGRLFDAYGPRIIMMAGTVALVISVMLTSICTRYYEYVLAQGVLFGLGVGMLFYPSLSAVSTHFTKHRATAIGIATTGSGVGGVVYPIMLHQLFLRIGFAWAVRISGFVSLALCLASVLFVTSRLPAGGDSGPWFDTAVFRDLPYILVLVSSVLISFGLFIPNFYIVNYAIEHSVAPGTAFYVLSVMNAGSILGRTVPSYLSDVFGRYNLIIPCTFFSGLLPLVFWVFATNLTTIMTFAAFYGFFSGAFNSVIIPCIAQISRMGQHGRRVGMLYSVISVPALCGGPAAGALLKLQHGSYTGMIILSGTTIVGSRLTLSW